MYNDFNSQDLSTLHVSEIEPLYWKLEDSLYDGNKKTALCCFNLLCSIASQKKMLLFSALKKPHLERLKEISYELYDNQTYQVRQVVDIHPPTHACDLPFSKEKEMRDYLCDNINVLSKGIGEELKLVGKEVKTDQGYFCDIVVESRDTLYPVELKIVQSNHAVVSQIQKYCFYFYRTLRYNHFKNIQGIVISNGYDSFSVNELRKNKVRIFEMAHDYRIVEIS